MVCLLLWEDHSAWGQQASRVEDKCARTSAEVQRRSGRREPRQKCAQSEHRTGCWSDREATVPHGS